MLNKFKKLFIFLTFTLLIFTFINNSNIIIDSVNVSINLFIKNLFVSLFPFFIFADFLINYNYIYYLSKIFKFKYSYVILMCMLSGLPSNAKYIGKLLENNQIKKEDAEILMSVTFFPNPMFVVVSIGVLVFNSTFTGIVMLLNIYLSNIIFYLIKYKKLTKNNIKINNNHLSFSSLLKSSILNNMNTLIVILGTIVFFTTLTNILFNYIEMPALFESIITSIFEMTSGIKKISDLTIPTNLKYMLISSSLSLSGLSILAQASSMLSNYNLDFKSIIKNKLIILLLNITTNYIYIKFLMQLNW